ncbi:hypothetical protein [Methylobacterium radiodurans]|nr:hypothetical protein [Methylobacterium radiodurans]
MQDSDPFSPGHLGAALAVTGLAALMLDQTPSPGRVATAAACLVSALIAFAVASLRRVRRKPAAGAAPVRAAPPARSPVVSVRVPADVSLPGRWSMPLSQRAPGVHPALSMAARTFQGGEPPAEADARRVPGQD